MLCNEPAGQQTVIGKETFERMEEHTHVAQTVTANPGYGKGIRKKSGHGMERFR